MKEKTGTMEALAAKLVQEVEARCWADNCTTHKAIPTVLEALRQVERETLEWAKTVINEELPGDMYITHSRMMYRLEKNRESEPKPEAVLHEGCNYYSFRGHVCNKCGQLVK